MASAVHVAASDPSRATGRPNSLLLWGMRLALVVATFAIYGSSLRTDFVGDDWYFLALAHDHPFLWNLTPLGGYHYNPLLGAIFFAMYHLFGLNPLPYHVLAYAVFGTVAVLVMQVGWNLTGRLSVGALAGCLFVAFGTQYEAAIWGLVAFGPGVSTALYLAGLLLYIAAHDPRRAHGQRRAAYAGFLIALVLGPFVYEQDITLIGACMLYRLLVMEAGEPFAPAALFKRAQAWLADFALPGAFFMAYLALKIWLAHQTTVPQLPGLIEGWRPLTLFITVGWMQAFIPGAPISGLITASLIWLTPLGYLFDAIIELMVNVLLFIKVVLVARFLLMLAAMLVVVQVVALGNIGSRHLLLITVPTAILWAMLLVALPDWLGAWLARRSDTRATARRLTYVPSIAVALFLVVAGVRFAVREQRYWASAVGHVDTLMAQAQALAAADPAANELYFINLPDSVLAPTGETMYEFRNSSLALVHLTMPNRFSRVHVACTVGSPFPSWTCYMIATDDDIQRWSQDPRALVLRYDPATGRFTQLTG